MDFIKNVVNWFIDNVYNVPELIRWVGFPGLIAIVFAETGLLVGFFLPEPFVSQYAPMVVVIPTVLALILTNSLWVIIAAFLTISILLVRAGGTGVYTSPATLILYFMIVGGLLARRLMAEASINTSDRAFWLLLAENWQTMAQDREAEQPDERDQVQSASSH